MKKLFNIDLDIIKKIGDGFHILPKRWAVERTFAWLDVNRRNSKYYERLHETAVAFIEISFIKLLLNRTENYENLQF